MVPRMHTQTAVATSPLTGSDPRSAALDEPPAVEAFPPRRLFTVDDVASILGVPRTFVYALARRGELPTVRVGERYVRFRAQALEGWIASQESTRPRGTQ